MIAISVPLRVRAGSAQVVLRDSGLAAVQIVNDVVLH